MNIVNILLNKLLIRPFMVFKLHKVGRNFRIGYSSVINTPEKFSFGKDFFSGPFCYFSTNKYAEIIIGDSVMFGPGCKVIGGNHNTKWLGGHMMRAPNNHTDKGIIIEGDVWFGANSIVLDGAFVSEGVVVAAGAVVTGFIPPYVIAMGVPAKKFKSRFNKGDLKIALKNSSTYSFQEVMKTYNSYGIEC